MTNVESIVRIGKTEMQRALHVDTDARGLIHVFEQPRAGASYVLGIDTSIGITGWTREMRTRDDVKTDNAAIEVIRVAQPDVQVAEFFAPIDHYELATVVNFLGRMYGGNNEDGQALACIEMNNGGWATQNELINKFGYTNLPPWRQEGGMTPRITQKFGWYSTRSTRKDLWVKGMRHINARAISIASPHLVEEMTDCTWDNFLAMTARGVYGSHDDLVVAFLLAIWYAHEASLEWSPTDTDKPTISTTPDYQRSDCTAEELAEDWDDRVGEKFFERF